MENNKYKVFEAFAGMGAWTKAMKNLDIKFEIVGYSEIDPYCEKCKEITKHIWIDEHKTKCNVCGKTKTQWASWAYSLLNKVPGSLNYGDISGINEKLVPDHDIFVYSPPCQAFSSAGKQDGFNDARGVLFFDAL